MFPVGTRHRVSVRQVSSHRFSLIRHSRVAAEIGEIAFRAMDVPTIGLANGINFRHHLPRPLRSRLDHVTRFDGRIRRTSNHGDFFLG
jgi:hypothetical protein